MFYDRYAFNQDLSKWNTSAVTDMNTSKCTLSSSLCGHGAFRCGVLLNIYDSSRFVGSQVSHVLFLFFGCGLKRDLVVVVCVVGLLFLLFVAPFSLLAVFDGASAFNQDVSKWNTGAVTSMYSSKYILSLPLCVSGVPMLFVVGSEYTTTPGFIGSQCSHVLFFLLCF